MPNLIPEGLSPLIAFVVTILGLHLLLSSGLAKRLAMDTPNHRSLHATPVPRVGGFILVPAFLLAWLLQTDVNIILALLVATLMLFSYLDDRSGLSVLLRFGVHLVAATIFVMMQLNLLSIASIIAAVLCIGLCTNFYNFMDGSDGLAGGMALFGFSAYGLTAIFSDDQILASMCLAVAAAGAGFLLFNFPPAKTFMGDAGSIPLGFLAGALGYLGWHRAVWPLWLPILVFSPFLVDAMATLLKRAMRGERVWRAHCDHYYQRLVRMGWSHRRLALTEYALMLGCAASALVILKCSKEMQYAMLLSWALIYAVIMILIDLCWKKYSATPV